MLALLKNLDDESREQVDDGAGGPASSPLDQVRPVADEQQTAISNGGGVKFGPVHDERTVPRAPNSLQEAGVCPERVEQSILKILYFRGDLTGRALAGAQGLKFNLFFELLDKLKVQRLIEVKRSMGAAFLDMLSSVFALTDTGRARAQLYLELNQYAGPVPVPLDQYAEMVRIQKAAKGWLKPETVARAYSRMVLTPQILDRIGPAISAGSSFLIYGKPGNGKTYLAEALRDLDTSCVFLPYALEHQGNIIQLYDPIYHVRIEDPPPADAVGEVEHDGRWIRCRRPFIMSGGELTLEMLDLTYNSVSKVYEAPLHLKANNGIYLIDDFGRQRAAPAEVLNRWIIPMERRVDYLNFCAGGKVPVPFETFLVFSTNLKPHDLGDEAYLRRITYKMFLPGPGNDEFRDIFHRFCADNGLECSLALIDSFIHKKYRVTGRPARRCHARDVLTHAMHLMDYCGLPKVLTEKILDQAFDSCFVQDESAD